MGLLRFVAEAVKHGLGALAEEIQMMRKCHVEGLQHMMRFLGAESACVKPWRGTHELPVWVLKRVFSAKRGFSARTRPSPNPQG